MVGSFVFAVGWCCSRGWSMPDTNNETSFKLRDKIVPGKGQTTSNERTRSRYFSSEHRIMRAFVETPRDL
ncbi:hypothetical protein V1478_010532 [Vespula squamosa]|uniref:Secreted protein n=1 Tax=Vespula squamosa TaxID=30214 RepID=A0ABD2AI20_VESSQ